VTAAEDPSCVLKEYKLAAARQRVPQCAEHLDENHKARQNDLDLLFQNDSQNQGWSLIGQSEAPDGRGFNGLQAKELQGFTDPRRAFELISFRPLEAIAAFDS
jgi:hypothetical protein